MVRGSSDATGEELLSRSKYAKMRWNAFGDHLTYSLP